MTNEKPMTEHTLLQQSAVNLLNRAKEVAEEVDYNGGETLAWSGDDDEYIIDYRGCHDEVYYFAIEFKQQSDDELIDGLYTAYDTWYVTEPEELEDLVQLWVDEFNGTFSDFDFD